MRILITLAVVVLAFSIGEGSSSHKKRPHHPKVVESTVNLCPRVRLDECRRAPGVTLNECDSDNDCKKGGLKCCMNKCGDRVCMASVKISTKAKSGSCPISAFDPLLMCSPINPSLYECREDSECAGGKKCCSEGPCGVLKCKDSIEERKGSCPPFKYDHMTLQSCKPYNETNLQCRKDADCKNANQKCCKNECGLLTCQNPTTEKKDAKKEGDSKKEQPKKDETKKEQPKKDETKKEQPKKDEAKKEQPKKEQAKAAEKSGSCPVWTFDPLISCDPVDPKFWECREDSECKGAQKCCQDGPCAVKKCKNVVEARKGDCPLHKFDFTVVQSCAPFSESNFKCRVDADCKQNASQKCCRDPCFLLTCQNAVAVKNNS